MLTTFITVWLTVWLSLDYTQALQCQGIRCATECPNGKIKDENGCDTCICKPAVPFSSKCGVGWEKRPESQYTYCYHDDQVTWDEARDKCKRIGGDLASINSKEEQIYIQKSIYTLRSSYQLRSPKLWLGGIDGAKEGVWEWANKTAITYTNWATGEPNGQTGENCLQMYSHNYQWNDQNCKTKSGYVCKKNWELDWEVEEKITDYGQNLTLFCEVDNCCTEQVGWLKDGYNTIYVDIRILLPDPTRKYGTFIRKDGFGLIIRRFNESDINITYSCSHGFTISKKKLLQFDDVFEEEKLTTTTSYNDDVTAEHVSIAISSIVGVVVLVIIVVYVYRRRSRNQRKADDKPTQEELSQLVQDHEVLPITREMTETELQTDNSEMRLEVDDMKTQMSEVIPANIQAQIKQILDLWQEEDKMFVSTEAAKHVLKCIKENSCVTVTGNSGIGKSFVVRHVALIMKGEGYTVIPICKPEKIIEFTKPGGKTLFVIDDIGGRFTLNQSYIDDWKLWLSYIEKLLRGGDCKCIATCRLQVFKDGKFNDLSVFTKNECKLCLTDIEKSNLSKKYFGDKSSEVSKMSELYDFFPLLCSLYNKEKFSDLRLFFSKPFDCYKQELDKLLNEGEEGRYKYCVLALVVMFNNKLSEDHLSLDYKKVNYEIILDKCKLNRGASMECLKDALYTLEGTFIVKDGDFYKTIHDKLFDFLAKYFGDKMLECIIDNGTSEFINERILWKSQDNKETDIDFTIDLHKYLEKYISRLVNDWSDGKVIHLFCSRNIKSPTFIVKLLDHIKQQDKSFQVKLANVTVDNNVHDTTLLQSCFIGDVNLTQWILDNTVNNDTSSHELCKDSIVNQCRDNGASPVYIACQNGHVNILKTLIENKADINKCMNDGTSPVYTACYNGHVNILKTLIENKADINKCMNDGTSPVYIACGVGHVNILKTLIVNKADINKCLNDGASPVYIACQNGHVNILKTLIVNKADINKCKNNGASPVYIACQNGHVNILKTLIENKADINKCENDGASPVYIACQNGHVNILKTLIENKADINKCDNDDTSPVYIACQEGHVNILKTLIEHKADINKCMNDGASPVYIACQNGHVNILKTLIEHKADINKCNNNGVSPVYIACQNGHVNILKTLIENKANINKCDNDGTSPVYVACYKGHVNILKTLIENKADINKCENDGASPVYIACCNGHVNILKTLIENKADINKCENDGASPVYIACFNGHVNILKTLIENKADINKCDNDGTSPLHIACYNNHINVVLVLLKLYKKEMIDLCDVLGNTPLHCACLEGSVQVVTPLLQHGANPHQCNNEGKSPLQMADDNGHVDVVTAIKKIISNQ